MKKTMFSLLMISAMFMIASCGSKSNSGEATANSEENEAEAVTPTYEPAEPPFTYKEWNYYNEEDVSLKGVFEIGKIGLTKVTGEIRYSSQLSGEGDCVAMTVNLKMLNDYPQKPTGIQGVIQVLDKNGTVILKEQCYSSNFSGFKTLEKGDICVLSTTTNDPDIDADEILANAKYVRIADFSAGKPIENKE